MKFLLTRLFVILGFATFFSGSSDFIKANAKESSVSSEGASCDTMGGRTGACGRCE